MSKVYDALGEERCLACGGDGMITDGPDPLDQAWLCPVCGGNGWVEPDGNMTLPQYDRLHKQLWLAADQDTDLLNTDL